MGPAEWRSRDLSSGDSLPLHPEGLPPRWAAVTSACGVEVPVTHHGEPGGTAAAPVDTSRRPRRTVEGRSISTAGTWVGHYPWSRRCHPCLHRDPHSGLRPQWDTLPLPQISPKLPAAHSLRGWPCAGAEVQGEAESRQGGAQTRTGAI